MGIGLTSFLLRMSHNLMVESRLPLRNKFGFMLNGLIQETPVLCLALLKMFLQVTKSLTYMFPLKFPAD